MEITEKILVIPISVIHKIYNVAYAKGFGDSYDHKLLDYTNFSHLTDFMNDLERKNEFSVLEIKMGLDIDDRKHYYGFVNPERGQ